MMKIVVLDAGTLRVAKEAWDSLSEYGEVVLYDHTPYDASTILERSREADIVLSNKVPLMREVLSELPDLKLICVLATGTNNVDHHAASEQGICVKNVPSYSTQAVAQHTLALAFELTNRVGYYNSQVHNGEWVRSRYFSFWDHDIMELSGKTVGLIGFGDIGRAVGNCFNSLGMKIIASVRTPRNPPDWDFFEFDSTDEVLRKSDIISLHCPQTPETENLINLESLKLCKSTALLINTARGGLIQQEDLVSALKNGIIAGAAVDVIDAEPMSEDHPFLKCPNLLITPHLAWASSEARQRLLAITCKNIATFLNT